MAAPPAYESSQLNPRNNPFFKKLGPVDTNDFVAAVMQDIISTLEETGFAINTTRRYAYPVLHTRDDDLGVHLSYFVNCKIFHDHPMNPRHHQFGTSVIFLEKGVVFVWHLQEWTTCWAARCLKETSKTCGGCLDARYCSAECQKKDWKTHKGFCKQAQKKMHL